jgi:tetratricopeptide (TPR) repeat protein
VDQQSSPSATPSRSRPQPGGRRLPLSRKLLFAAAATVIFFAGLEAVLALVGVAPRAYEEDPYVGFSGRSPLFVEVREADGSVVMERAPAKASLFNMQRFPKVKAAGTTRIFCMGASTTYGHPYEDPTSFCGWLRELLNAAQPDHRWEVVNAGGISYASYRVALLMEELAGYEPDLFIIYSGHNEFLERRSYPQIIALPRSVRGVGALASRTRTWTAVEQVVDRVRAQRTAEAPRPDVLDAEVKTLLDDVVGPSAFTRDDRLRDQVMRHFRFNLARMVDIARSAGAEIVMVTPASNLRDSPPFKSEHRPGMTADESARWTTLVQEGLAAARGGDVATAAVRFTDAAAIDPRHADGQYALGQSLLQLNRFDEARRALEAARDEDICPLRALTPMPDIVREVAAERSVPLIDFVRTADERAPNGIPGSELFLDHVHPTIEGYRLIALALLDEMISSGMVEPRAGWGEDGVRQVVAAVEGRLDNHVLATGLLNLSKTLGWAGKLVEAYRLAQQALELDPDSVQVQYQAGLAADLLGRLDEAMAHYQRTIEILPTADLAHGNLAVGLEKKGRLPEAVEHYRLAFEYSSAEELQHNRDNLANALLAYGYRVYGELRFEEAVALLEEADRVRPNDPEVLNRLGTALMAVGRPQAAIEKLEAAVRIRPDDAGAHNRLALALALAGRPDEAAAVYRQALALNPRVVEAPDNLFTVLGRMGRTELAGQIRATL